MDERHICGNCQHMEFMNDNDLVCFCPDSPFYDGNVTDGNTCKEWEEL